MHNGGEEEVLFYTVSLGEDDSIRGQRTQRWGNTVVSCGGAPPAEGTELKVPAAGVVLGVSVAKWWS